MTHAYPASIDAGQTAKRTVISVGLLVGSLLLGIALATAGIVALDGAGALTDVRQSLLGMVASEFGYLLAGLAFLSWAIDGSFVSLRRPTGHEVRVIALGVASVSVFEGLRQLGVILGLLETAGSVSVNGEFGVTATLALLAIMIVVAPPMEELLFRGVIQRYVSTVSSPTVGIAIATLLFVPMHVIGILTTSNSLPAVLAAIGVLCALSIVVGYAYVRTDTLLVPIGIHATYNAVAIAISILVYALS